VKTGIHPAEGGTAFVGETVSPTFCEIIKNNNGEKTGCQKKRVGLMSLALPALRFE
jgi:hypothetical protein